MKFGSIYKDRWKILIQSLFWGSLWMFVPFMFADSEQYHVFIIRGLIIFSGIVLIIGINLEWLLPRFFFTRKYWWYGLTALVLVGLVSQGMDYIQEHWIEPALRMNDAAPRIRPRISSINPRPGQPPGRTGLKWFRMVGSYMPYLLALVGSALFEMVIYANRKEKEAIQLRNEKLETEMKFLKSQINPHFLFNTLNNIYTLTLIKSDKAPEYLLKLSEILRYMLYECNTDKAPLQKEAEYIRNYIDLKKLKDSEGLKIEVNLLETYPNLKIAPLLFIPFVENAFKHSKIEDLEKGWIRISLTTDRQRVYFRVENSISDNSYTKDKVGGIGLKNVERQLELLYPDQHRLEIVEEKDKFSVALWIDL